MHVWIYTYDKITDPNPTVQMTTLKLSFQKKKLSFPGGSDGKESACNATQARTGSGRCPGEGNGYPLQ